MTDRDERPQWETVDEGWGHDAVGFATTGETQNVREYLTMHHHLGISAGEQVLDMACGSGLALELASLRGAAVRGIDASPRLIAIARDRLPDAELVVGDINALPWEDGCVDVVTTFRGIWATTPTALVEAARVLRPGGRIGVTVWGHIKASPGAWGMAPFALAAPDKVQNQVAMVTMGRPGVGEAMLADAGFTDVRRVAVRSVWEFPDPETYAAVMAGTGPGYEAKQAIGAEAFREAAIAAATPHVRDGLPLRVELDLAGFIARTSSG